MLLGSYKRNETDSDDGWGAFESDGGACEGVDACLQLAGVGPSSDLLAPADDDFEIMGPNGEPSPFANPSLYADPQLRELGRGGTHCSSNQFRDTEGQPLSKILRTNRVGFGSDSEAVSENPTLMQSLSPTRMRKRKFEEMTNNEMSEARGVNEDINYLFKKLHSDTFVGGYVQSLSLLCQWDEQGRDVYLVSSEEILSALQGFSDLSETWRLLEWSSQWLDCENDPISESLLRVEGELSELSRAHPPSPVWSANCNDIELHSRLAATANWGSQIWRASSSTVFTKLWGVVRDRKEFAKEANLNLDISVLPRGISGHASESNFLLHNALSELKLFHEYWCMFHAHGNSRPISPSFAFTQLQLSNLVNMILRRLHADHDDRSDDDDLGDVSVPFWGEIRKLRFEKTAFDEGQLPALRLRIIARRALRYWWLCQRRLFSLSHIQLAPRVVRIYRELVRGV